MRYLIATALAALALNGAPALAAEQGVTDTEILIGEVDPFTGPPALLGKAHSSVLKLAFA